MTVETEGFRIQESGFAVVAVGAAATHSYSEGWEGSVSLQELASLVVWPVTSQKCKDAASFFRDDGDASDSLDTLPPVSPVSTKVRETCLLFVCIVV